MPKTKSGKVRPLTERLEIARKVNAYRAAHPGVTVGQAIDATKVDVKHSAYYAYNARLQLAEEDEHNGEPKHNAVEFPLAIIPAKPGPKPKRATALRVVARDDDRQLAADLLDVAARLLRR